MFYSGHFSFPLKDCKGKGDLETPSVYRSLNMKDTARKLLGKLAKQRLTYAVYAMEYSSPKQYDFRAGRSTVDATAEVVQPVRLAEAHNVVLLQLCKAVRHAQGARKMFCSFQAVFCGY